MDSLSGVELNNGRYFVRELIGRGGMQSAWRAEDRLWRTRPQVVIKTPQTITKLGLFRESARMSAQINHPNVAQTLDYFEEDGAEYLVEELVESRDLRHSVLAPLGRPDPFLASQIIRRLAKAVAAAHRVKIVHRDLKPENILVDPLAASVVVKISDFGVATLAGEALRTGARAATGTFGKRTFETDA